MQLGCNYQKEYEKLILSLFFCFRAVAGCHAQEPTYFVTYSHDLEEPGNLGAREWIRMIEMKLICWFEGICKTQ
jgi:hypothetical protein